VSAASTACGGTHAPGSVRTVRVVAAHPRAVLLAGGEVAWRAPRKPSGSCFGWLLSGFRLDLGFQRGDRGGVGFAPGQDVRRVGDAAGFLMSCGCRPSRRARNTGPPPLGEPRQVSDIDAAGREIVGEPAREPVRGLPGSPAHHRVRQHAGDRQCRQEQRDTVASTRIREHVSSVGSGSRGRTCRAWRTWRVTTA
jgi:hypothetical protein